jgi:hypothetical protein
MLTIVEPAWKPLACFGIVCLEGVLVLCKRLIMKKLALLASAALITFGSVSSAEAQRYHRGWHGGYYHNHSGNGGALAAGLIGGALLGGLITAAATPAYSYPAYSYPYGGYSYYSYRPRVTYGGDYPYNGYGYGYPYYGTQVVYQRPPVYRRVVYRPAPVYRRVVYRPGPVYRNRVVYAPRYRDRVVYAQPRYRTRVVYRQNRPARVVRTDVRRNVVTTGSIRRYPYAVRVRYR